MYWWRTERLKLELLQGPLGAHQATLYLICWNVLYLLASDPILFDPENYSWWSHGLTAASILLVVGGTVFCYIANGGRNGHDFLGRITSISWVVTIRMLVWGIPLMLVILGFSHGFDPEAKMKDSAKDVVLLVFLTGYAYWRTSVHIRSLMSVTAMGDNRSRDTDAMK